MAHFSDMWREDDRLFTKYMSAFHGIEDLGTVADNLTFCALLDIVDENQSEHGPLNMSALSRATNVHSRILEIAYLTWILPFTTMTPQKSPCFRCTMSLCPHSQPEHWFLDSKDLRAHMLEFHVCNRKHCFTKRSPLMEEVACTRSEAGITQINLCGMGRVFVNRARERGLPFLYSGVKYACHSYGPNYPVGTS
jgi:hypothetical protein